MILPQAVAHAAHKFFRRPPCRIPPPARTPVTATRLRSTSPPGQQPSYGTPQGQYYPNQQPPKKKRGVLKWGLGCLGLIVLVTVLAVACTAIATSGGNDEDSSDAQSESNIDTDASDVESAPVAGAEDAEDVDTVLLEATASGEGHVVWGADGGTNTETFTGTWSKEVPSDTGMLTLTVTGDILDENSEVSCTLTIDGEVKDEATGSGAAGGATCIQPLF